MTPITQPPNTCPSAETLQQIARERTGLDDFGDAARDTALQAYVESVATEVWPDMTDDARHLAVDYMSHQLENRLRLMADRKRHPEIATQTIRAPLIVVGPPRSGSTLLHNLLSLDPESMAPINIPPRTSAWTAAISIPSSPATGTPSASGLVSARR